MMVIGPFPQTCLQLHIDNRLESDKMKYRAWGCSSAGRAPRSQRGGRGFEPPHLHQDIQAGGFPSAFSFQAHRHHVSSPSMTQQKPTHTKKHLRITQQSHLKVALPVFGALSARRGTWPQKPSYIRSSSKPETTTPSITGSMSSMSPKRESPEDTSYISTIPVRMSTY